jgi:acylphosphatase
MRAAPPTKEWARRELAKRALGVVVSDDPPVRLTAFVKGRVQGVGFRWWTRARALELGLVGSATNLDDGRVEVVAEGPATACRRLLALLAGGPGQVEFVAERWGPARGDLFGFYER